MKMTSLAAAAAIAIAAASASPAMAAQRFDFQYGCSATTIPGPALRAASCATVTGSFDLDHAGSTLAAGDYYTTFSKGVSSGPISNLSATVEGASSGNGTFGASDFSAVTFVTLQDLDLTKELVGQGGFGMSKFGDDDFNLFAAPGSSAPSASFFNYEAATNGGLGDAVKLTSLRASPTAAVPEPATWATMILGMGAIGVMMRRGRRAEGRRAAV